MKKVSAVFLVLVMLLVLAGCSAGAGERQNEFYEKVSESQRLLDSVADSIYNNWHAAVYNDEFDSDITVAVASALAEHERDIERIKTLDGEITELFTSVKSDKDNGALIKRIMAAYNDYYEFVVNVSGSFESYSANKEPLKKELASLLKELSYSL